MFDKIKKWSEENWFDLKDSIPSDWDRYWDWIPSVTTALKLIKDPWFEYVKRNYPKELEQACDKWKIVHTQAEDYFDGTSTLIHKQIMKFHILYDVQILDKEKRYEKDWMQWTVDLVCMINGQIKNIDYKSSSNKSKKYLLQMWWYKYLNWYDWWILYLSPKWFNFVEVENEYLDLFIELKNYFTSLV